MDPATKAAMAAHNRPASGMPANGSVWGAKGAGIGGPARHPQEATKKNGSPNTGVPLVPSFDSKTGRAAAQLGPNLDKRAQRQKRAEEAEDKLYELFTSAERQETQLAAAKEYLNRVEGMPIARNINANVDDISRLSDAELDARLADLARRTAEDVGGEAAQGVPEESPGVVH